MKGRTNEPNKRIQMAWQTGTKKKSKNQTCETKKNWFLFILLDFFLFQHRTIIFWFRDVTKKRESQIHFYHSHFIRNENIYFSNWNQESVMSHLNYDNNNWMEFYLFDVFKIKWYKSIKLPFDDARGLRQAITFNKTNMVVHWIGTLPFAGLKVENKIKYWSFCYYYHFNK